MGNLNEQLANSTKISADDKQNLVKYLLDQVSAIDGNTKDFSQNDFLHLTSLSSNQEFGLDSFIKYLDENKANSDGQISATNSAIKDTLQSLLDGNNPAFSFNAVASELITDNKVNDNAATLSQKIKNFIDGEDIGDEKYNNTAKGLNLVDESTGKTSLQEVYNHLELTDSPKNDVFKPFAEAIKKLTDVDWDRTWLMGVMSRLAARRKAFWDRYKTY
jgi:hypothetical protein